MKGNDREGYTGEGASNPVSMIASETAELETLKGHSACTEWPVRCPILSELLEGSDGARLIVVDVEDCIQLGELQQVVDLLGQLEQLESWHPGS